MKKIGLFITVYSMIWNISTAQQVSIATLYSSDTVIPLYGSIFNVIYGLSFDGNIQLNSDSSLVRLILVDSNNNESLLYESYPILDSLSSFAVTNRCDETCLLDAILPNSLRIEIINSTLFLDVLHYKVLPVDSIQLKIKDIREENLTLKIAKINSQISKKGMIWHAGLTSWASLSYSKKKELFGVKYNLEGFEYYEYGFFQTSKWLKTFSTSSIVKSFDWRKRHGANNPSSSYYTGDEHGWISPPKYQNGCLLGGVIVYLNSYDCAATGGIDAGAPLCWAFGTVGAVEAVTNLYFNQHIDPDLSVQEIALCTGTGMNGGQALVACNYIRDHGVVNTNCFPYTTLNGSCTNDICSNPTDRIFINGSFPVTEDEDEFKTKLIGFGPLSALHATWMHTMTLVGFDIVKEGDYIDYIGGQLIPTNSPYIGQTYWIFKNSGLFNGWPYQTGYTYMLDMPRSPTLPGWGGVRTFAIQTPITSQNYDESDRLCRDEDGDGYYNWGIGTKPTTGSNACPVDSPDEKDCDDSNPLLGYYDPISYECQINCSDFIYNPMSLTISSNITWSDEKLINTDIIIESNASLKIINTVKMVNGSKIIVKQGGKLTISGGGTIKGTCNNTWQGIEIQGNSTLAQTESNQGVLELKNGAVIENAITAIKAESGAIVRAENCTLRNNVTGIQFEPYNNTNYSYIKNSRFETTANLNNNQVPDCFVKLNGVKGIKLEGNTFVNTLQPIDVTQRGKGIVSNNSQFSLIGLCSLANPYGACTGIRNKFENLYYGIEANNFTATSSIIKETDFINNVRGIWLKSVDNAKIQYCNFNVAETYNNIYSYGIYLDNSKKYTISYNTFNGLNGAMYGIYTLASGSDYSTTYKNTFSNLKTGIQIASNNFGLQIKCNQFSNISENNLLLTSRTILPQQGTCTSDKTPANNLFTNTISPYGDILFPFSYDESVLNSFRYTFKTSSNTNPIYSTSNVIKNTCTNLLTPFDYSISCPSPSPFILNQSNTTRLAANNQLNELKSIIDGGNTQQLLNVINSNISVGNLKEQLLSSSPYLSDEVLLEMLNKTNQLPAGVIKEIIIANSPVTEQVYKELKKLNSPLPAGIFNEINTSQTGTSARYELEQGILYNYNISGYTTNEIIQYYLFDTTVVNATDSLEIFLQNLNTHEANKQLIQLYLSQNRCNEADALLNTLKLESESDSAFYSFYSIFTEICLTGDSTITLSPIQITQITQIAELGSDVSGYAQSLLSYLNIQQYPEIFEFPEFPDTTTIYGYLIQNAECGGLPFPNDTIVIKDEYGNIISEITSIVTDNNGYFRFNFVEINSLDSDQVVTIATKSGYKLQNTEYKTIAEWKNESPLTFTLANSNLEWSDLWSSPDSLVNIGTAIDLGGYVYVAGRTLRNSNLNDVVLMKFTPQGERLWLVTYNTGKANDNTTDDLAIDKDGNSYLSVSSTMSNVVLLKYNTYGILQWQQTITNATTAQKSRANAIDIDNRGNICITGFIENTSNISNSTADIFVASYQPNGTRNWLKTYHKADFDMANDIICDKQNNVYITGMANNYTTNNVNLIVLKYNKNGILQWEKEVDLGTVDIGNKILIDNVGNIIIGATANDKTTILKYTPLGIPQWQSVYETSSWISGLAIDNENNILASIGNMSDYVTVKYSKEGIKIWETKYNDDYNGFDYPGAIITDTENNVYVTGRSATVPKSSRIQLSEIVTLKYDKYGNQIWLNKFNNNQQSSTGSGNDMVISENGNIYITGYSSIITSIHHSYLTTLKYSQCPATANLKSTMFTPQVTANNETIEDIDDDELIQVINFKENKVIVYPNPYAESTRIELITKTDAQVSLEVYTMGGKLIENIFTGFTKEGKYNYTFSAKNKGYSAGTYVLKIMVNNEVNSYWLVEMK